MERKKEQAEREKSVTRLSEGGEGRGGEENS
jgi:hypothetical protein